MKKTRTKHLLRTIRKNGVSFFAVGFIAATSIAIFLGFQSTANAVLDRADDYFRDNRLETLEISCANGITPEDIEAISGLEGVDAVEGGYSSMIMMDGEDEKVTLHALSLCSEMNEPVILDGTLPASADEVAIEEKFANEKGLKVGDELNVEHDGCLVSETFHVSAIINHPSYCCATIRDARGKSEEGLGSASYYIQLPKEAFDTSYYDDCFSTAYVRNDSMDEFYYFSDEYADKEADFKELAEELGKERAELRFTSLDDEAQTKISDAQTEIDDAQKEIADAETEIADGQTKIDDAEIEIADGETKIADAETEIADGQTKIDDAEAEIADGQTKIDDAEIEIADAEKELSDAETEISSKRGELDAARGEIETKLTALGLGTDLEAAMEQLPAFGEQALPLTNAITEYQAGLAKVEAAETELDAKRVELENSKAELESKKAELESSRTELESKKAELESSKTELEDSKKELADSKKELEDSKKELEDSKVELEDAKAEVESAQTELDDAKEDAQEIQLKDWIVVGRDESGDVRGVRTIVDSLFGLSYSMSVIFLLVAIIVCHAAITRMIEEQRVLIGAQKALGFRPGEILKHYMLYNTFSGLLGILIGFVASVVIVEILVLHIYSQKFLMGSIPLTFALPEALLSAAICMVVFWTATYAACAKLVRQPATTLLRGEVPVQGRRYFFDNWKCYKRLNLYSRTMIKNVLNDKGRMLTTIMGVVGCISLLLICFSLKLAMENSSVWQFDKYFLYDNRLVFDSSSGNAEAFEEILDEEGISYTLIQDKLESFRVDNGSWESGRIAAIDDCEEIKDFMVLQDIYSKETVEVPDDGVLVSRRCAEEFGLSEGSTVEFMDSEGAAKEFKIAGVMEHYIDYHLFVTTAGYFEEAMGEEKDACVFLLKGNIDGLLDKVRDVDGFLSLRDNSEFDADSSSINPVIGICLLLAAVLALLVLLNQVVMYINRKARELAVMRINGYTLSQTRAYIYKDSIILTVLGLLIGCGFGVLLSYAVIRAVETGAIHYVRTPNAFACLVSCGVVALFALIVNLIGLRKIKHLNLTNVSGN